MSHVDYRGHSGINFQRRHVGMRNRRSCNHMAGFECLEERPLLSPVFTKLADLSTPIPSGTGTFTFLNAPAISGDKAIFRGAGASEQEGFYLASPGSPLKAV